MMTTWTSFLFLFVPLVHSGPPRSTTTHEEIREAIISLAHHLQSTTQKLERHELREKQLGDQLKKALSGLDTRGRAQESKLTEVASVLNGIEDNLKRLESTIQTKNEQEKGMYTIDTVPLQSWMSNVEGMLHKQQSPSNELILSKDKLERLESVLTSKIDSLTSALERLEAQLIETSTKSPISKELSLMFGSQHSLQEDWHRSLMSAVDRNAELLGMRNIINTEIYNSTKADLEKIKHDLIYLTNDGFSNLHQSLQQGVQNKLTEMYGSVEEIKGMMNGYFSEVQGKQEDLLKDVRSLTKVEPAILQTADNVMDTKRRIEYGIQEIVLELSDIVKNQGKELNETVNRRFNDISSTILENQNGGLSNLSSKIEMEISQVWRQIGIMYKQLIDSTSALDKLQKQTEKYVNGSLSTMDSMDGQVGEITGRVSDVKENLNYLMGRLLLVTQEFNQTKTALATAFDNLRKTFKNVQEEVKNVGPGPIPIDHEDNKL